MVMQFGYRYFPAGAAPKIAYLTGDEQPTIFVAFLVLRKDRLETWLR